MKAAVLSTKGQIVIPAEIRRSLGLKPGDKLWVDMVGGEIRLRSTRTDLLQEYRRRWADGPSVVEVLLAERRRDREREG